MVLIALLIALSIERLYHSPALLHWDFYLERWQQWSAERFRNEKWHSEPMQVVRMLLPALAVGFFVVLLNNLLVTFIVSVLALLMAINCEQERRVYKAYLTAARRGDSESAKVHQDSLESLAGPHTPKKCGDTLIWINYRQYSAVMLYFVLFGSFGALVYATLRFANTHSQPSEHGRLWQHLLWLADWVPARLAGFGLLIVGHFSRALPEWIRRSAHARMRPDQLLFLVADKAEERDTESEGVLAEALHSLRLMRRQQLFWVCVIAVLTIWGWVI